MINKAPFKIAHDEEVILAQPSVGKFLLTETLDIFQYANQFPVGWAKALWISKGEGEYINDKNPGNFVSRVLTVVALLYGPHSRGISKIYRQWNSKSVLIPTGSKFIITIFFSYTDMAAKGIAGRAILIDWYGYASSLPNAAPIDAFSDHAFTFTSLMAAAGFQGLSASSFRPSDILIVRSGYLHQYATLSESRRKILDDEYKTQKPSNIGIEPSKELLEFLWEKKIAAVAGDARSFEAWPCKEENLKWHLHEWLLAGWGKPIGELFDLEELTKVCRRLGRWSFFLSSEPLNVSHPCWPRK